MQSSKTKVLLTIIAIIACPWAATPAQAVNITTDLSAAERAAVARMFKSLSELVVMNGQVSDKEQNHLAAELMRSLGVIAKTSARKEDSGEPGLDAEKLFNAIGVLVELGEETADTAAERRAVSDLMRTIGAVAAAHTDADQSATKAPIKNLFDAMADLIAQGDDPEAEKRFASQLFLALGALVAEAGNDSKGASKDSLSVDSAASQVR